MTLNSSDINNGLKQEILKNIRIKLGEYEYQKLVDSLGEDGIIEAVIQQAKNQEKTPIIAKKENKIKKVFTTIITGVAIITIALLVILVFTYGTDYFNFWYGKIITGFFLIPFAVFVLGLDINVLFDFSDWTCIIGILLTIISLIIIIWGIIQGLVLLF